MSQYRVVKYGDLYQVQYKYKIPFFKEQWAPMLKYSEGPFADFDSLDDAISFASQCRAEVVWTS